MFLLNLSLPEFVAIFGSVSGLLVALYLLDRSRKKQKVATLRFWISSQRPNEVKHRKRIQQPWSLLLQLLSIALLLLAVAQLQFGTRDRTSRDHILILDTSAWMGARIGNATLMDAVRSSARSWLRVVPAADRVMVVRADALVSPATAFEANREVILDAIRQSRPGSSALNLEQALAFADRVRKLHARRSGEIVLVGSGRISADEAALVRPVPDGLRFIPISTPVEDCGLRKIGLRRSTADPDLWDIFVSVRNYGSNSRTVPLALQFGGAPVGSQKLMIAPGTEQNAAFEYKTRAAGWLEARLLTSDSFPQDDRALLELPPQKLLKVVVYSNSQELLKPLFADSRVQAEFRSPAQYEPKPDAKIMIVDGFRPSSPPQIETVWIEPPSGASPIGVLSTRKDVEIRDWRTDHVLGAGLRVKGLRLASAQVYAAAQGDIPVAETEGGPVILARPGKLRTVVLGFHPMRSEMRYELATPLLFANIIRWMSPETFRRWELNGGSVGTVSTTLDDDVQAQSMSVSSDGERVPYTVQDRILRFFVGNPSTVRVLAGDREMVYSLTLPQVAEAVWSPPPDVRRGLPRGYPAQAVTTDLWKWLAIAGALGLLLEWILFGRRRAFLVSPRSPLMRLRWKAKPDLRRVS